jgi:hypothetical protein
MGHVSPEFFEPLDDELLDLFEGKGDWFVDKKP